MAQSNLVELAQTGDADAIAALMNASLKTIGVTARAVLREGNLHVLLESDKRLPANSCIEFIRQGIAQLDVKLCSAFVYSRVSGQKVPAWVQCVDLGTEAASNPFVLSPEEKLELEERVWFKPEFLSWNRGRLFDLLLLSIPLLVVFTSVYIWNKYLTGGPLTTDYIGVSSELAPDRLISHPDPFAAGFQRANQAVKLTKASKARQLEEWQKITQEWRQATALMQAVPASHPKYAIAQQKVQEYQRYAEYVAGLVGMQLKKVIAGGISPKAIAPAGQNQFFVPNGAYNHTITVYDREYNLVKTISGNVTLADYGLAQFKGTQQGSPIAAAATQDGQTVWVANYQMVGEGFQGTVDANCSPATTQDPGFLYRIGTQTLQVDQVVRVGSAPSSMATTPDNRFVLVSNWCSWDVSVVDTQTNREVRRLQVGPYPRGIAIDAQSQKAYVAILGSYDIVAIDLKDFSLSRWQNIGQSPHQLSLDPTGKSLYVTLSGEGQVAKVDLATQTVVSKVATGDAPRSMAISSDGKFLYVVNYNSNTLNKVRTQDMQVVQTVDVNPAPIGVTYDAQTNQVWVACQSGSILVFQD